MLRSWDFLDHGDERITPILSHPEQGPVNSEQLTVNSSLRVDKQSQMCDSTDKNCSRFTGYCSLKRKAAFTLAEVLITLGIIGVVAALTLPTLISNYQKRVYVTQLKKSVSVLSNGFHLMMAHDGVTELKDTEAFSGMASSCSNILSDNCRSMKEGLESVFSGIQFTAGDGTRTHDLAGEPEDTKYSNSTVIKFPDGLEIWRYGFNRDSGSAELFIDVNGSKNPNTWGRDIFELYIRDNKIIPYGSQVLGANKYWKTATNRMYKCDSNSYGYGCAARVLEEDAMNY